MIRARLWSLIRPVLAFIVGKLIVGWCWACFGLGHALCWVGEPISTAGWALRQHVRDWKRLIGRVATEKRAEATVEEAAREAGA